MSHRVGKLAIGDVALACAVAADHRREAFETCSELVEEVKQLLPVWKHQSFADGDDEWVNRRLTQSCAVTSAQALVTAHGAC